MKEVEAQEGEGLTFPVLISEVKNQGTNDQRRREGLPRQARGNAIERLGKDVIGLRAALMRESIFRSCVLVTAATSRRGLIHPGSRGEETVGSLPYIARPNAKICMTSSSRTTCGMCWNWASRTASCFVAATLQEVDHKTKAKGPPPVQLTSVDQLSARSTCLVLERSTRTPPRSRRRFPLFLHTPPSQRMVQAA